MLQTEFDRREFELMQVRVIMHIAMTERLRSRCYLRHPAADEIAGREQLLLVGKCADAAAKA